MDIILASGSPRRRELLTQMGLTFRVVVSDVDEGIDKDMPPEDQVYFLSQRKARAVAALTAGDCPGALVIAADTIVSFEGEVMGKPHSQEEAVQMLSLLQGKTHQVYTGFTLCQNGREDTQVECTSVTFRPMTDAEIAAYAASGEPMDKAGAYGIQGLGGIFVEEIQGDYFNVMGLPICRLGQALKTFGVEVMG